MLKRLVTFCAPLALLAAQHAAADPTAGTIAQSGRFTYTAVSFNDTIAVYEGLLESQLSAEERDQLRAIAIAQFNADPEKVTKGFAGMHNVAVIFASASLVEKTSERERLWEGVIKTAPTDRFAADSLALMRHHGTVLAEGDGLVVTKPELEAMFTSEDLVAEVAGQPHPSAQDRAQIASSLGGRFAALSPEEKDHYAHAELRWAALRQHILSDPALRAKAVALIKNAVHKPEDVAPEARMLEGEGMKFVAMMNRFTSQAAQISGLESQQMNVEGINFASRKFLGMGH